MISPLTHMVKTKIGADQASGTTTSIAEAETETFVKAQTHLTVSVFDNFIALRDINAAARKAGEVARVLVVSTQKSKKVGAATSTCSPLIEQDKSRENDDSDLAKGTLINADLIKQLPEIRKLTDDMASTCNNKRSIKERIRGRPAPLQCRLPNWPVSQLAHSA